MEKILIIDFGGQYNHLIARRVRESHVYCEVKPYTITIDEIKDGGYKGIIFTGGPASVYSENAPRIDTKIFDLGIPILGICYGAQLIAYLLGGVVSSSTGDEYNLDVRKISDDFTLHIDVKSCDLSGIPLYPSVREYGKTSLLLYHERRSELYSGINKHTSCWMSHTDYIRTCPHNFIVTARTNACPIASMENSLKKIYALQFHPEVSHTPNGLEMIQNFLYRICKCTKSWQMSSFIDDTISNLRTMIGNKKVLCAISGGVDSAVAAVLVHKAIGDQLTCIFVDHGLLRKNEANDVIRVFRDQFKINLIPDLAENQFLVKLEETTDPEQKRMIIGTEFIRIFEEAAKKRSIDYLVQGTIYPDVIESGNETAATIKSHHNVGGIPKNIEFKGIIEPLRNLFKDEVREVGLKLGIPDSILYRQPFPGPGLAIRVIGDVTKEKLDILREADAIFRDELIKAGLDKSINQFFAVLTNLRSVGVMGDGRTYDYAIALRAVNTTDFMTADWSRIPYDVLERVSNRIVNEVRGVNRVLYDITSKPPATIEYE